MSDRDDLVRRALGLADCDARAGEPLGKVIRELVARVAELEALIAEAREVLEFYREHVEDCNRHGVAGDAARNTLAKDLGEQARALLAKLPEGERPHTEETPK